MPNAMWVLSPLGQEQGICHVSSRPWWSDEQDACGAGVPLKLPLGSTDQIITEGSTTRPCQSPCLDLRPHRSCVLGPQHHPSLQPGPANLPASTSAPTAPESWVPSTTRASGSHCAHLSSFLPPLRTGIDLNYEDRCDIQCQTALNSLQTE